MPTPAQSTYPLTNGMLKVEVNFKPRGSDGHYRSRQTNGPTLLYAAVLRKKGLIVASRSDSGRRHFAPGVLDQLALIALGQAGGLSLDESHTMLSPDGAPRVDRGLLLTKADEIDATIKRLKAMSEGLRHAAACPAEHHAECPSFQRLLNTAVTGRFKPDMTKTKV